MKKLKLIIFATCLMAWCVSLQTQAQQICASDAIHRSRMQNDAAYATEFNAKQILAQQNLLQMQKGSLKTSATTLNVPVVVHVVHLGEPIGTGNNISDANIQNIINDLNSRFSASIGSGVNMDIQFCLAVRAPNNTATTGIIRHDGTSVPGYAAGGVDYNPSASGCGSGASIASIKALSFWPSASYLNIWLVKSICGASAFASGDGVFFHASSFTSTTLPLGAHEVGHWFGLGHVWNDADGTVCPPNTNCAVDGDAVCDTPPIKFGDCNTTTCNLGGYDIYNSTRNYLYVGVCTPTLPWDRFTQGQKDRVWALMPVYHATLSSSLGCVPLSPNEAGITAISNPTNTSYTTLCGGAAYSTAPVVKLQNGGTSTLTSVSIKYRVDNNAPATYSWTGTLAPFTTANVTLPSVSIPQGAHTFQAYTTLPNGVVDTYNNNDSGSVSVTITGPAAITATTSQTNTTCAGSNGTATVNASGGTLITYVNNLTDFETPHGWTTVNGTQANIWCAGTAAPYAGTSSMYVSAAANACANNNTTGAQYATVHFYKDFTFPANASNIQVTFVWRNNGGSDSTDYFNAYLVPTTTTPVAGTLLGSGKIGGKYFSKGAFSPTTISGLDANVGTSKRLVFTWDNDWYMLNPAASIDNINVSYTQTFTYAYAWSNGQTTQTATGLAPGTYTCTITDANGCTGTKSVIILNGCAGVSITAGGPTTFCQGGNVVLTSSLPSGNVWSNGATTQNITVSTSGSYNCSNNGNTSNTIVVTVNPIPLTPAIINVGPTTFCQGGSVTLSSSSSSGNLWSTGATTQSINVTTSGNYAVTITQNGCTSSPSNTIVVTVNPIPSTPTISAGGPTTFCTGGSVTLTSSAATGNLWSTGATTQSISATTSGNYTVAVTSNGCTSSPSSATTVTVQACSISISAGGPTTFCQGGNVVLTSSQPTGNLWSNGATSQSITVTTSGSYSCTYSGNTSNTIVVTVNPIPATPTISAGGPTTFCAGGSVTLTSSSTTGNTWTPGGATTQSISVTTSGTYTVKVTSNGCTSSPSAGTTVTVQTCGGLTITAGGPTTFCSGGSVVITSSLPSGNVWSNGATTQSITVTTSGSYSCTNSGNTSNTIVVTVNPLPNATISANNGLTFCSGNSTVLTVPTPGGTTQVWTLNGAYFATASNPLITGAGVYGVTVTNTASGCTATSSVTVTVKPLPPVATSQSGTVSVCSGSVLNGQTSGNAASVDGVDDYIDAGNGAALQITGNLTLEAWINASSYQFNSYQGSIINKEDWYSTNNFGYTIRCGNNGQLSFNLGSDPGVWTEIQSSPGAMVAGTWYHVAATYDGATMKLYINGNLVASTPKSGSIGNSATNLYLGSSQLDLSRTFNGQIDEVRIWNIARTQTQIQNNMNKYVQASSSGLAGYYRLDEASGTAVLESVSGNTSAVAANGLSWQVPSSVPWNPLTYSWSNGATTQGIVITTPATYTVTVTAVSGCTAVATPVVISSVKPTTPVSITAGGSTTICPGGSVSLSATAIGNAIQFDGSNDYAIVANPMIPTAGNYSILFWAKETVAQGGFREIISQGRNFYIGKDNTGIIRLGDGWLNTGVAWPTDLQWHHYAVVRSATNTFLYIDGNLAATKGSAIGSPIVVGGAPNNFIIGEQWAVGGGEAFGGQIDDITIWNNQRTQAQIQALMSSSPGLATSGLVAYYKLDEGTGSSTVDAVSNANAAILTNGPSWIVPSSIGYNIASYLWSTTATTQSIIATAKGTYKVTATNNEGCTSTATKKVYVPIPKATITVTGSLVLCGGSTVTFSASSGAGYTYQWTKNNINIGGAINQIYVANTAGTYKVIVTNADGCTKLSGGKVVTECSRFGDVAQESAHNLSVYPNPAIEFITVSFDSDEATADVELMNTNGAMVMKQQLTSDEGTYEESLDVTKLAPGMYVILVKTQNEISTKRFVKQ